MKKVHEGTRTVMGYKNVFPVGEEFGWDDTKHFHQSQYLLMHSVIYRTELLQDLGLKLPEHTFYVDNIFVFKPLPSVRTMYYLDVDMYRYFIGREDQSVNEKVMYARRDQQLRVTRIMIDAMNDAEIESKKLERYMLNYLSMMMCICSIFLRMEKTDENEGESRCHLGIPQAKEPRALQASQKHRAELGNEYPHRSWSTVRPGGLSYRAKDFQIQLAASLSCSTRPIGAFFFDRMHGGEEEPNRNGI